MGLLLVGVLDLGRVAAFGLALAAGLDPASGCDGDLALRLIVPALDVVALLLVFAAALAFGTVFVFFLATMRAPSSAPNDSQPCRVPTATNPKHNQGRSTGGKWRSKYPRNDGIVHRTTPRRYSTSVGARIELGPSIRSAGA